MRLLNVRVMRWVVLLAGGAAVSLAASTAAALVTEPNGMQVPVNSAPQVQLDTLFQQRGETINSTADAQVVPNAFSPLCGFTATFVLNEAANKYGLAWYNETGVKPLASQLHTLVSAGSPVGTSFTGTAIKNDPAYLGGLVGFALVGGETHYTNAAYDTLCSGCNPQGNWITALMYASTATQNAYYVCFEDGATTSSGWNNDGDFNDDVFFVTGITCSGGGQPCDTGKPGICAAGVTQCTGNGTACQQLSQSTTETCNGLDDDCNGMTDEGAICPAGEVCDKGTCVQSCASGEFPCSPDKQCSSDGYCVDPSCQTVTCPAGQVCNAGVCKGPCDGVVCPVSRVCRVGRCVDPCAGVSCSQGQVCDNGVCVSSCTCLPCGNGKACNAATGLCVDAACQGAVCPAGEYCAAGACVDACTGAMCPTGQACMAGQCVASQSSSSSSGSVFGTGGGTSFGSGGAGGAGASTGGSGGSGGTVPSGGSFGPTPSKSSCGCRLPGDTSSASEGGLLVWAALALTMVRRRRERRR